MKFRSITYFRHLNPNNSSNNFPNNLDFSRFVKINILYFVYKFNGFFKNSQETNFEKNLFHFNIWKILERVDLRINFKNSELYSIILTDI